MKAGGPCGLCGRRPASGYASSWTQSAGEVWYCHEGASPTCYERHDWPDGDLPEWMTSFPPLDQIDHSNLGPAPLHDLDDVAREFGVDL